MRNIDIKKLFNTKTTFSAVETALWAGMAVYMAAKGNYTLLPMLAAATYISGLDWRQDMRTVSGHSTPPKYAGKGIGSAFFGFAALNLPLVVEGFKTEQPVVGVIAALYSLMLAKKGVDSFKNVPADKAWEEQVSKASEAPKPA